MLALGKMSYNQVKYAICTRKCSSLSHFFLPVLSTISLLAHPELQGGRKERGA